MKIHEVLAAEIERCAAAQFISAPTKPWGVMVLSAPPEKCGDLLITETTTENVERIFTAVEYIREHPAWRTALPYLILNGEVNQLPMMLEVALGHHFPADRILLVDCGRRPTGNTQTQFTVLRHDVRFAGQPKHIVVVSSWYHIPRVARTIAANSPKHLTWSLLAQARASSRLQFHEKTVEGEVRRIVDYIQNGSLSSEPIGYLP